MGNAGNALDLLRWTPGVIVGMNEDISLIGRDGKTEVYINDRRITNNAELKAVTSQNIKRVEIIREPDAQYASNVAAVVKLYTHSPYKDNLGASLMNVLDIKRRVSNITTLTLDAKQGKWSGNASLSYGFLNSCAYSNGLTRVADERAYEKIDSTSYTSGGNDFKVFAGLNYAFTPRSVIGLQFNGNYRKMNINQISRQQTEQYLHGFSNMDDMNKRNSLSASYQWQPSENSQLLLIADYAASVQQDEQNIREYISTKDSPHAEGNTILKYYTIVNSNDYDIVTATARYNFVSREWDNKTGVDTDLLATPSYTFEANTTDYANRFKLVFTTGSSTGSDTFAYFNGNEWVINNEGEATLQVVDVTGRVLSSEQINGSYNNSLNLSAGVYVLRLNNGNTVKTQKIVID